LGIGDWGLGIGDWGLGIGPNPQSPIIGLPIFDYRNNNISILKCNNFKLIKDQNKNIFIF
jgi:hypothetical protein